MFSRTMGDSSGGSVKRSASLRADIRFMRELVLSQLSGATPETAAGAPKLKLRWRLQLAESIDSDLDAPAAPQTDRSTYRDAEGVAKILQTQAGIAAIP
jgi:hypothetical protein